MSKDVYIVGVIESYRRGPRTQTNDQLIIGLIDISKYNMDELVNKEVIFEDEYGNKYIGYIKRKHGNSNKVLVEFKRPPPPSCLGKIVKIMK